MPSCFPGALKNSDNYDAHKKVRSVDITVSISTKHNGDLCALR